MYWVAPTRHIVGMSEARIFQKVLEVAPSLRGEGASMTLLWDGGRRAVLIAEFEGQEITAEITPARLLADVHVLQEQACDGRLQVVHRNELLISQLQAATVP